MHWRDLVDERNDGLWIGLLLRVPFSGRRPPVHIQAGRRYFMRIEADGKPLLWARVSDDHYGYEYLRPSDVRGSSSVIPPISFDQARAFDPAALTWARDWARFFAEALRDSTRSVLYAGTFSLGPCPAFLEAESRRAAGYRAIPPSAEWLRSVPQSRSHAYADWDLGKPLAPLPLRATSKDDDGRVKAYRKLVREGCLPPVLLWWICGLQRYVVLDGHDRLLAALLEDHVPTCFALVGLREEPRRTAPLVVASVVQQIEEYSARGELLPEARRERVRARGFSVEQANRLLIDVFDDRPNQRISTRAWPLRVGSGDWRREVIAELAHQRIAREDAELLLEQT